SASAAVRVSSASSLDACRFGAGGVGAAAGGAGCAVTSAGVVADKAAAAPAACLNRFRRDTVRRAPSSGSFGMTSSPRLCFELGCLNWAARDFPRRQQRVMVHPGNVGRKAALVSRAQHVPGELANGYRLAQ